MTEPCISMKDLWSMHSEKFEIEDVDFVGIRIALWKIIKFDSDTIYDGNFEFEYNLNGPDISITKLQKINNKYTNNSFFWVLSENEISKRSKTIQDKAINNKTVIIADTKNDIIIRDLIKLNKYEIDDFKDTKLKNKENLTFSQRIFNKNKLTFRLFRESNNEMTLCLVYEVDTDTKYYFSECIDISLNNKKISNRYFVIEEAEMYKIVSEHIDSIEIFKSDERYQKINALASSVKYKQDPMLDDSSIFCKLIDLGIPTDFLTKFIPGETCFEFQLIPYYIYGEPIGPIYINSNNY